jgi:amino acid permease
MLGPDSALTHTWILVTLLAVVIFPLTLLRRLNLLGIIATGGSIIVFVFVAILLGMAIDHGHGLGGLAMGKLGKQTAVAAGSIAFSYDCQVNVFANYRELDRPAGKKTNVMALCTGCGILGSLLVYLLVAVGGWSLYGASVEDNVLNSMSKDALTVTLNLTIFVVVIPDIPLLSFEVTAILQDHLLGHSFKSNFASNFIFVATSAVAAAFVPNMQVAFAYVGATTAVALNAIVPPFLYLCLARSVFSEDMSPQARDAYVQNRLQGASADTFLGYGKQPDSSAPSAPLPAKPSARFISFSIVYLTFGCLLLPTMLVQVALTS